MTKSNTKAASLRQMAAAAVKSVVKGNVNKGKNKNSGKKKKTNGGGGPRAAGLKINSGKAGMPNALGSMPLPLRYRFGTAPRCNGVEGLRVEITCPALRLGVDASTVSGDEGFVLTNGTYAKSVTLDPSVSSAWLHPGIPLLTGCFDRFKVRKARVSYRPSAAQTSVSAPFVFAYTDDAKHPSVSTPTEAAALGLANAFEFNAWESWDLDLPVPETNLLYAYDATGATADYRLQDAGAMLCMALFTQGTAVNYGIFYLNWLVDLYEFSPIFKSVSFDSGNPRQAKTGDRLIISSRKIGIPPEIPHVYEEDEKSEHSSVLIARPQHLNGLGVSQSRNPR